MLMKAERKHGYCKNFQSTYNLVRREKQSRRKNQGWRLPGWPVVGTSQTSNSGAWVWFLVWELGPACHMVWPKNKIKLNENLKKKWERVPSSPGCVCRPSTWHLTGPKAQCTLLRPDGFARDLCGGPETPGQTVSRCCTAIGVSRLSEVSTAGRAWSWGTTQALSSTQALFCTRGWAGSPNKHFSCVLCAGSLVKAF